MIVLDSSAVLAVLYAEPGGERVVGRLPNGLISAANMTEVLSKMAEIGEDPQVIADRLAGFGVRVEPVTADHALTAARLRPLTRHLGLSLGDRLCLALAIAKRLSVLTTDRAWRNYDFGVTVEVIR